MALERASGSLRSIKDRLGSRFHRHSAEPALHELKKVRKPDEYHYLHMTQLINNSFGGELPDDMPTIVLTRYFDFWKKNSTHEDIIIEEASAGYWKPIMQALRSRERHMITASMHALSRNPVTLQTLLDVRELDEKNPAYLWLGRSCKRVLSESFKRSEVQA